jgi:hypothetical protein
MKNEEILDIFYNYILKEAASGVVDCFMKYNICFSTIIREYGIEYHAKRKRKSCAFLL